MTEAKRKAKILLLQRNETFDDVAKAAGLALATVHNVLEGKASSRKSRQAITNALGAQVFADVPVTESFLTFDAGTIIRWPNESQTSEFLKVVGPVGTEIRKNLVKLLSDVQFRFTFNMSEPALTPAQVQEVAAANDPDNVIEIWGPGDEAEALAEDANASSERAKPAKRHTRHLGPHKARTP